MRAKKRGEGVKVGKEKEREKNKEITESEGRVAVMWLPMMEGATAELIMKATEKRLDRWRETGGVVTGNAGGDSGGG
ncbi:UNVERIFIED_CONTAM: hypothetical protein Sradi_4859500 [Sesamum radiatum]|uniref:Uncharacterized protein n=1 Tax=Sesamum radiatum TaxID=300843 RepID=A0AAW2N266_SESRA